MQPFIISFADTKGAIIKVLIVGREDSPQKWSMLQWMEIERKRLNGGDKNGHEEEKNEELVYNDSS